MVDELSPKFSEGWSFLQMCEDKHGQQWTGEHRAMEELVVLGQAAGFVALLAPREMWPVLPGGMPYYQTGVFEVAVQEGVSFP